MRNWREVLLNWKLRPPHPQPGDWVFASPHKKGKQPYWPGWLIRVHLKPALEAAGIPGSVGWHTRRHTFGTLMKANGEDIKTIQDLYDIRELQGDCRHLHTSPHSHETRSANKACQKDSLAEQAGGRKAPVQRVIFSYGTVSNPRRKGPIPTSHLDCW
jgi:hypothetical protein